MKERSAMEQERMGGVDVVRTRSGRNVSQEEIARRAYELFMARGGQHGHAQEDWYQAERELRDRAH